VSREPKKFKRRSEAWFNNPANPSMTALYVERYLNYGLTREELQSGRPIIGIAQTGSDLSPCNRAHLENARRVREGIREAGGIAIEFPVHPIQETSRRPTAAIDRNLAYLGLVEILHGYPLDGVVLTTGCDKTTPACLMAAATANLPAICLSGGPMLDGWYNGKLAGSGTIVWESRLKLAAGEIDYEEFMEVTASSATSPGHCNTMGTASTMNALAEGLGMSLPNCAAIPAPYRERLQMAYETGKRIVAMVVHINAIAKCMNVELDIKDWQSHGYDIPLLVNMQPAGEYLGESFHRAGGVQAVLGELQRAGKLNNNALTVNGKSIAENCADALSLDERVIKTFSAPIRERAGFLVMSGNLFDSAVLKTSVISEEFQQRFLKDGVFEGRAIVFEGSEDYHDHLNEPSLNIDETCILVMRGTGPVGWPGSAEVVNMQPPDALIKRGITELPCIGDGRQSGTSASPSILNASPESVTGGGLSLLQTGDTIRIDMNEGTVNMLVDDAELANRTAKTDFPPDQTPWQTLYRATVGQLSHGACIELAEAYHCVTEKLPRHNH